MSRLVTTVATVVMVPVCVVGGVATAIVRQHLKGVLRIDADALAEYIAAAIAEDEHPYNDDGLREAA